MLDLTDPASARVLDLLDGSRTEGQVARDAARLGIRASDVMTILAALRGADLVVDSHTLVPAEARRLGDTARERLVFEAAAIALRRGRRGPAAQLSAAPPARAPSPAARLRRRLSAEVLVTGSSQLAVPSATALAGAGVGHGDPDVDGVTQSVDATVAGLLPTDASRPRGVAALEAVRRSAPDVDVTPIRRDRATFAVLVGFTAPAALTALAYRRLAHLAVSVRDGTVVVGPLVRPGIDPCLNCLDLHRLDRDPAWRFVAPQLRSGPDDAEPLATTTALTGAAYAADEVLTHLDGGIPHTVGATAEITAPGALTYRRWSQHPGCDCRRRARTRAAEPPYARGECFN
jgi:bacteriocin biosynthesis cyclodehydratase domain-containing protein